MDILQSCKAAIENPGYTVCHFSLQTKLNVLALGELWWIFKYGATGFLFNFLPVLIVIFRTGANYFIKPATAHFEVQ